MMALLFEELAKGFLHVIFILHQLSESILVLAHIFHTQATAAVDISASTALLLGRPPQRTAGSAFAGASLARLVSAPISTASLRAGVRKLGSFSFVAYDELYGTAISYRDDGGGPQWAFSLASGF